jgi:ribosome-binding factor A
VSDAIQRLLGTLIPQEIRDPRIGMVNINDVNVTRDMAYAKVYITFVGVDSEEDSLKSVAVLNKASGFLRTFLAKELSMRTVPKLQFIYDKTSVRGQALSSLIDKALADDRARNSDAEEPDSTDTQD